MLVEIPDDLFLEDFGSSVIAGAVSGLGILDRKSQMILDDRMVIVEFSVIVRTDLFGDLQYGTLLTVDGEQYRVVHEPIRIADGRFSTLILDKG